MKKVFAILLFVTSLPLLAETSEVGIIVKPKAQSKTISFSEELGMAAIAIPEQVAGQSIDHFSALTATFNSGEQIQNGYDRFGQWLNKSEQGNGIWLGRIETHQESPLVTSHNINFTPQTAETKGFNAAFNYGRFSAETALITDSHDIFNSGRFYLQGSYTVINNVAFNLAITAKVETLNQRSVDMYYGNRLPGNNNQSLLEYQAKNTTLGIVGTYSLTPQWTLMGAITSTSLDKDIEKSPLINANENINMALIGTSYSF